MTSEIQRRYPNRKMFAYPDASGAQRRTSAGGITDHIILKNSGMTLRVGATNPSVKDRIASVNSVCKSQDGATKLTISPKCTKLINALRKHTYKEGTRQPEKDTGLDHFCDALGYLVNNLYPVRIDKINSYGKLVRKI
jgi:RecJ-like exonuclease